MRGLGARAALWRLGVSGLPAPRLCSAVEIAHVYRSCRPSRRRALRGGGESNAANAMQCSIGALFALVVEPRRCQVAVCHRDSTSRMEWWWILALKSQFFHLYVYPSQTYCRYSILNTRITQPKTQQQVLRRRGSRLYHTSTTPSEAATQHLLVTFCKLQHTDIQVSGTRRRCRYGFLQLSL